MIVRKGHIPTKIVYVHGAPKTIKVYSTNEDLTVTTAYVADAENKTKIEEHKAAAINLTKKWNPNTSSNEEVCGVSVVEEDNVPMSGVRLCYMDQFSYIPTYRCVLPNGFFAELSKDVLLEAIIAGGVEKGGFLSGEYIWAVRDKETFLVRVDSELYDSLLDAGERGMLATIRKKDLRIGKIYQNRQGDKSVFLGYVDTDCIFAKPIKNEHNDIRLYQVSKKEIRRSILTFNVSSWELSTSRHDIATFFQLALSKGKPENFEIHESLKVVKEIGEVEVPDDVVEDIRMMNVGKYLHKLKTAKWTDVYILRNVLTPYSPWLFLRKSGEPKPKFDRMEIKNFEHRMDEIIS